jgi:16S rRNA (uracil1498-N3)-methyltransferase
VSERRFLVPPADIDTARGEALIRGDEHHHLSRVLRLRPGDIVSLFDGAGGGHHAVVEAVGRETTRVRLTGADTRPVDPDFRLTLAQAIPHSDRMEWVIQKATELGVERIVPIPAARSVVRPRAGRWERLERWRRVAQEAARQSGRRRVPAVEEPRDWQEFLAAPSPSGSARLMLQEAPPAGGAPSLHLPEGTHEAWVAVGPEGGWTSEEIDAAARADLRPIHLGPRILRTETAGVVAVALVMFLAGELGSRK